MPRVVDAYIAWRSAGSIVCPPAPSPSDQDNDANGSTAAATVHTFEVDAVREYGKFAACNLRLPVLTLIRFL